MPTDFRAGRVPTVTLCVLDQQADPAGVCFGTEQRQRVSVRELTVDGHRMALVASPGDGSTADELQADWHGAAFTSTWQTLGWLGQASGRAVSSTG